MRRAAVDRGCAFCRQPYTGVYSVTSCRGDPADPKAWVAGRPRYVSSVETLYKRAAMTAGSSRRREIAGSWDIK